MKLDELHESDLSGDEERHANLVNAISELDSVRRVRAPTRKELSSVVSEFHLPTGNVSSGDLVNLNELTDVLKSKTVHSALSKKLKAVIKNNKTLPKPLEKAVAERIKRAVSYGNVATQLKRWNSVVEKNRVADHVSFPLQQGTITLQTTKDFLNKFKSKTPLEMEMSKILGNDKEEVDETDEEAEFPLTLQEMIEKKKEMAKLRAKMSYQEAKAYRQSKIKSKKYHRILKRDKIKQQLKEFEQLQKSDPQEALKKLEELDKTRAQERASLRHKNTGKWAKSLTVKAKYNKEIRKELAEQLKLSRDLTEKVSKDADSDDDVSESENTAGKTETNDMILASKYNPWGLTVSSEVTDLVSSCEKYWEKKSKESNSVDNTSSVGETTKNAQKNVDIFSATSDGVVDEKKNDDDDNTISGNSSSNNETNCEKNDLAESKDNSIGTSKSCKNVAEINGERSKPGGESVNVKSKIPDRVNVGDEKKRRENSVRNRSGKDETSRKDKMKKRATKEKSRKGTDPDGATRKKLPKNKVTVIHTTSGTWTVSDANNEKPLKRKADVDIDDLFQDLDDKLVAETSSKISKFIGDLEKKKTRKKKLRVRRDVVDTPLQKNKDSLRPDIDEELLETAGQEEPTDTSQTVVRNTEVANENNVHRVTDIDPGKFIELKPKILNTKIPDNVAGEELFIDDDENTQKMNVIEAFSGDDVMEEFQEMKKEEEESTKLEVPTELPGWGSWGGTGIVPGRKRKKTRYKLNLPKLPKRKDHGKADVIISEKSNGKIVEHMVKEVPHPFKSVGAFEANLRHPVGREWNPEMAHLKFIKKSVETQLGSIIEPMDEKELVRAMQESKSLYRGKKKEVNRK